MRFTVATAVLATSVAANGYMPPVVSSSTEAMTTLAYSAPPAISTVYETTVHTITSCGPEVTNCPAHSTVKSTEVKPVTTTAYSQIETMPTATMTYGKPPVYTPPSGPSYSAPPPMSMTYGAPPPPMSMTYGAPPPPMSMTYGAPPPPMSMTYGAPPPPMSMTYGAPPPPKSMSSAAPSSMTMGVPPVYTPPTGPPSSMTYVAPPPPGTTAPPMTTQVCVPSSSVISVTKSYTTVMTTVELQTVAVQCSTGSAQPTGGYVPPPPPPSKGSGNGSYPPPPTSGASSFTVSAIAIFAGVAALVLV